MMLRSMFAKLLPFVVAIGLTLNHFVTPAAAGDKLHTLLLLEQGFSSIQNRARQPLFVPFEWIKSVCIVGATDEQRKLVEEYLALLSELSANYTYSENVETLLDCGYKTNFFVKFSSDHLWFTEDVQSLESNFEQAQIATPDPRNYSSGIALTNGTSLAYVGVVWIEKLPFVWNRSLLLQELYQGTTGGLDVDWAGTYFSILQEINLDTIDPEVPVAAQPVDEYITHNATGLCIYDAFAIYAISRYIESDVAVGLFKLPSSEGLIKYVNENFDYLSMRFDEMHVIQRYPGLFDTRCI